MNGKSGCRYGKKFNPVAVRIYTRIQSVRHHIPYQVASGDAALCVCIQQI